MRPDPSDSQTPPNPVVSVSTGQVRGTCRDGSVAFYGIPYAAPPVGPLQFAAPQPPIAWEGIRDATEPGATALQETMPDTLIPEPAVVGNDYLTVNVYTPTTTPKRPLPVFFWIHGGGFTMGSPIGPWYQGEAFNRDDVIVVTCGYRLGFTGFGWLPGKENNRAVRDWVAALQWVQDNIAAFGGDPARVTIGGQSAGGTAVLTLLTMPSAEQLFQSVWASSPVLAEIDPRKAMRFTYRLAKILGVPATAEGFADVDASAMFQGQAAASEPTEKGVAGLRSRMGGGLSLAPVIDGDLIPRSVLESIRNGVGADKSLVIGSNNDELFGLADTLPAVAKFVPANVAARILGIGGDALKRYRAGNPDAFGQGGSHVIARLATDEIFRVAVAQVAQARANRSPGADSTWVYTFDWASPTHGGAVHCVDVPFLFDVLARDDTEPLLGTEPPQSIADDLHQDAVDLIKNGAVDWPQWDLTERTVRVFDGALQSAAFGTDSGSYLRRGGYDSVNALV